eukprot:158340-Chlamydomonas_euryale.AAC.1
MHDLSMGKKVCLHAPMCTLCAPFFARLPSAHGHGQLNANLPTHSSTLQASTYPPTHPPTHASTRPP